MQFCIDFLIDLLMDFKLFSRGDYAALFVQSAVTPHTGRTADGYALTSGGDNLVREGVGEAWRVRDEAGPMACGG